MFDSTLVVIKCYFSCTVLCIYSVDCMSTTAFPHFSVFYKLSVKLENILNRLSYAFQL